MGMRSGERLARRGVAVGRGNDRKKEGKKKSTSSFLRFTGGAMLQAGNEKEAELRAQIDFTRDLLALPDSQ